MAFWKPGASHPNVAVDRDGGDGEAFVYPVTATAPSHRRGEVDIGRRTLPIFAHSRAILYAVEMAGVVILVAETGSGKSTQVPQYLYEAGWATPQRRVAVTQPRRMAAVSLAARVASEMGVPVGTTVGHVVRFDEATSSDTCIQYMTDGMLVREALVDPLLSRYSVIMLDEAHERGLQTDILAGLLKRIRRVRPSLRVIVSSATLEAERFHAFFSEAPPLPPMHPAPPTPVAMEQASATAAPRSGATWLQLAPTVTAVGTGAWLGASGAVGTTQGGPREEDGDGDSDVTPLDIDGLRSESEDEGARGGIDSMHHAQSQGDVAGAQAVPIIIAREGRDEAVDAGPGQKQADGGVQVKEGATDGVGTQRSGRHHRHGHHRHRHRNSDDEGGRHRHESRSHASGHGRRHGRRNASPADSGEDDASSGSRRHRSRRHRHGRHRRRDGYQSSSSSDHGGRRRGSASHGDGHQRVMRTSGDGSNHGRGDQVVDDRFRDEDVEVPHTMPTSPAPTVHQGWTAGGGGDVSGATPVQSLSATNQPRVGAGSLASTPVPMPLPQPAMPTIPSEPASSVVSALAAEARQLLASAATVPSTHPPPPDGGVGHAPVPARASRWGAAQPLPPPVPANPLPMPALPVPSVPASTASTTVIAPAAAAPGSGDGGGGMWRKDLQSVVLVSVPGRCFDVTIHHATAPVEDYVAAAAETALNIHVRMGEGDVLIFLPGVDEIHRCAQAIADNLAVALGLPPEADTTRLRDEQRLDVHMLHASLPWEDQMAALAPSAVGKSGRAIRKVIVATNMAETSVTIDGVVYVIDCGLARMPVYDVVAGVDTLLPLPISRASAAQRAGRAGRVSPGHCFRLYTAAAYHDLAARTPPEIVRCDLAPVVITLLGLGLTNPLHFPFMDPPLPAAFARALELLHALGGVTTGGGLTHPHGAALGHLPCDPRAATLLLAAMEAGCAEDALTVAAFAQVSNVFMGWRAGAGRAEAAAADEAMAQFAVNEGDAVTWLNVYAGYEVSGRSAAWCAANRFSATALRRVAEVRSQLHRLLAALIKWRQREDGNRPAEDGEGGAQPQLAPWTLHTAPGIHDVEDDGGEGEGGGGRGGAKLGGAVVLRKCLLRGYCFNIARLAEDGRGYITLKEGHMAALHPQTVFHRFGISPPWVVYGDAVRTSQLFLRDVTAIKPGWIMEVLPHVYGMTGGHPTLSQPAAAAPAPPVPVATPSTVPMAGRVVVAAPLPTSLVYQSKRARTTLPAGSSTHAAVPSAAHADQVGPVEGGTGAVPAVSHATISSMGPAAPASAPPPPQAKAPLPSAGIKLAALFDSDEEDG